MQCAIDNAKRTFNININEEIDRIQRDMDININGYPLFWKSIKKRNDIRNGVKLSELTNKQIEKRNSMYNSKIICPMNSLYNMNLNPKVSLRTETYSMNKFYKKFELDLTKKKSKKVEKLIEKYALQVLKYNINNSIDDNENEENYLLLRSDFDNLIKDIREIVFTKNYLGLMSYLINRSFVITPKARGKIEKNKTNLDKNKSLLLKTLYELNSEQLLKCFSNNIK